MATPEPLRRKVLCYSPYTQWSLPGMREATVLQGLALRGAEVKYVLCDGLYSDCDLYQTAAQPRQALACSECKSEVAGLMLRMGIRGYEWLGRYLLPEEIREAEGWALRLPVAELADATYQNFQVGRWVRSSVRTHLRVQNLNLSQPEQERRFRSYLYSGLVAGLGLSRLLDEFQPEVLFLYNGRLSSTRVALELAKQRGIRVVRHEQGHRGENLEISVNQDPPVPFDFPLITGIDETHGEPRFRTLDALLPGKDTSLDRICNIVLEEGAACDRQNTETVTTREKTPQVSVIVTSYNYAQYLSGCLSSVLDQTLQDFEVIVLDDLSTDATPEVVQAFLKDGRFRYIRNKANLKQPRNCNKGSFLARGKYLCFLHADDRFLPHNLERKVAVLESRPEVPAVFSTAFRIDGQGNRVNVLTHPGRPDQDYAGNRDDYHDLLQFNYLITPGNVLVRREAFEKAGRFNEKLINGCDWDLWIQVAKQGGLAYINAPLMEYRIHDAGLHAALRRKSDLVVKDSFWMLDRYFNDTTIDPETERRKGLFAKTLIEMINEIPSRFHKRYLEALKLRLLPLPVATTGDLSLEAAREYERREEKLTALSLYLGLLRQGPPDEALIHLRLGSIFIEFLQFETAASHLAQVPVHHPDYYRAAPLLAYCLFQCRDYEHAEVILSSRIDRFGPSPELLKQRLDLYLEQWRLDAAARDLKTWRGLGWEEGCTEMLEEITACRSLLEQPQALCC